MNVSILYSYMVWLLESCNGLGVVGYDLQHAQRVKNSSFFHEVKYKFDEQYEDNFVMAQIYCIYSDAFNLLTFYWSHKIMIVHLKHTCNLMQVIVYDDFPAAHGMGVLTEIYGCTFIRLWMADGNFLWNMKCVPAADFWLSNISFQKAYSLWQFLLVWETPICFFPDILIKSMP